MALNKNYLECLYLMCRGVGVGLGPPPGDKGGNGGVKDETLSLRVEPLSEPKLPSP